jgi:hypothetical protein
MVLRKREKAKIEYEKAINLDPQNPKLKVYMEQQAIP